MTVIITDGLNGKQMHKDLAKLQAIANMAIGRNCILLDITRLVLLVGMFSITLPISAECNKEVNSTQQIVSANNANGGLTKMTQQDLEARGKALRKMFDPYIARANGKEDWKFTIVLKDEADEYFPKGMKFEDAIVVLKAAGFNINTRPVPRDGVKYWQFAWLSFPNRYVYQTGLSVGLEPDFERLEDVRVKAATITIGVN